ncbi:MAG: DeoR/GlpR family DNA-binding transcription regulator [Halanaerobiaceae bacterium]
MPEKERQLGIIAEVRKNVGVSVKELADKFEVSANTIRSDLEKLEAEGIVKKIHGAAVLNDLSDYDLPFNRREIENKVEKNIIGKKAASLINEDETIIVDAGTTCLAVANHIKSKKGITVLTNSVAVARELDENPEIVVILSGGVLKGVTRSLIGPPAEDFFELVEVDKLFLAAGAVSIDKNRISNPNLQENPVKKSMMKTAEEVILVIDSHKLETSALYPFASFEDIDKIIIDNNLTTAQKQKLEKLPLQIIYAS